MLNVGDGADSSEFAKTMDSHLPMTFHHSTYLVDPASSHMLVSKTKPCMSKYKQIILRDCGRLIKTVTIYSMILTTRITVVILQLIRAQTPGSA